MLAGYLAVAIDNAQLYASLQDKIVEYERLKDFNENIVESSRVGVVALGLNGAIESWNTQMEAISGLTRSFVIGRSLPDVFGSEFARGIEQALQSGGIRNIYKVSLAVNDALVRTVNVAVAPLVTRELQKVGHLILVDDITDRLELEQKLAQSERLSSVGLLAAGVAHEVNTPLAVISSYTQMLAKQMQQDDPRATLLQKITEQTFRASEIIGSLLHFSRTRGSELSEVDLNMVIRETLALVEHPLKTAGIKVTVSSDDHLPPILGNSGKLQQDFLNLALNARDAMPSGGALRIVTRSEEGRIIAEVIDTGMGMSGEVRERVFDPFFTTKNDQHARHAQHLTGGISVGPGDSHTERHSRADGDPQAVWKSGTGLGLSVSYGIVQEHGGTISVDSKPGEGSRFLLQFPTASARGAGSERANAAIAPQSQNQRDRSTVHA
jgi:PAS domain S-box-containing protein